MKMFKEIGKIFNRRQRQEEQSLSEFYSALLRAHEEEAKKPKPMSAFDYWFFEMNRGESISRKEK